MYLLDESGKRVEVEDPRIAARFLRSGKYTPDGAITQSGPTGDQLVRTVAPDGSMFHTPMAQLPDALEQQGHRLATTADTFEHDSGLGGLAAAGLGLANAGTLGTAAPLLDAATGNNWSQATMQQHPAARLGVELPASILLGLAGGIGGVRAAEAGTEAETALQAGKIMEDLGLRGAPVSATGELASGAVAGAVVGLTRRALKAGWGGLKTVADWTPTGKLSGATTALQDNLAGMLTKELLAGGKGEVGLGTNLVAAFANAAGHALGAAPEAAVYGISQAVNEQALGDPRDWGELLESDMAENILLGSGLAFGMGALKGAAGAVARRVQAKVVNNLTSNVEDGTLGRLAMTELDRQTINASNGTLTAADMEKLKRKSSDIHDVLRYRGLIPDGLKPDVPGGNLFVDVHGDPLPADTFAGRVQTARDYHGEQIGAYKGFLAARQAEAVPPEQLDALRSERDLAMKYATKSKAGTTPERAQALIDDANTKQAQYIAAVRAGPYVNSEDVAKRLKLALESTSSTVDTPYRKTLTSAIEKYAEPRHLTTQEIEQDLAALRGNLESKDPAIQDKKAAYRDWNNALRTTQKENAGTKLGADGQPLLPEGLRAQWDFHDKAYSGLRDLNRMVQNAVQKGAPVQGLLDTVKRAVSSTGRIAAIRGSFALRSVVQSMITGGASTHGLAGLAMMGPAAALGVGGRLIAGGLLPGIEPTAAKIGEIAYKVAQYKQWGTALETLDNHFKNLTMAWMKKPSSVLRGATIIGENVIAKAGGEKDPSEGARVLQRRFAALTSSPEMMATYTQQAFKHMQGAAPTAGLAAETAVSRQALLVNYILQTLNNSRQTNTFQPSLAVKQPFSAAALSKAGRQLAAITMPKETEAQILAGLASDDIVSIYKAAHPQRALALAKTLHYAIANATEPLTPAHKVAIAKLTGARDASTLNNTPTVLPQPPATPAMASRQVRATQQTQGQAPAVSRYQHLRPSGPGGVDLSHRPEGAALQK